MLPVDRAEDVVQEALLRTYAVIHSGTKPDRLRPWLFQVAHNAAIDALRSRPPAMAELDAEQGDGQRQDRLIESRHTTREVLAAVSALPERQREAIVLRELEGRSYADIGRRLGASGSAVRQLIVRARRTVRAAAAAFTPAGLVARFPWLGNSVAGHTAEVSAGAGVSAASVQVWVAALVTCTMGGSVVVLSKSAEDAPPAVAKAVEAPVPLDATSRVSTLVAGEAKDLRSAALERARAEALAKNGPGENVARQVPAPVDTPAEVTAPPPGCGAPPVGSSKRRRARRSCGDEGPLAVGNTGPNDPPGGQIIPINPERTSQPAAPPSSEPAEDRRDAAEPPPDPPPPPNTGTDPRDDTVVAPPATVP